MPHEALLFVYTSRKAVLGELGVYVNGVCSARTGLTVMLILFPHSFLHRLSERHSWAGAVLGRSTVPAQVSYSAGMARHLAHKVQSITSSARQFPFTSAGNNL